MAVATAAPQYYGQTAVAHAPVAVAHSAHVTAVEPAKAHVYETHHAGPAHVQTHVQHGVVGHRTVQVGSQTVQVGSEAYIAGQSVEPQAPYTYVAGQAVNTQNTVPIAPPALPVAAPGPYALPKAPVNLGPAPADTVTQEKILAPARGHTVITPQVTRVEPELQVNQYNVDVPRAVPVPVEREVVVEKVVQKPYHVEVPRPVPVAVPHKVHPVHEVVHTPVVRQHTVSVHQPVVHAHAAPVALAHKY